MEEPIIELGSDGSFDVSSAPPLKGCFSSAASNPSPTPSSSSSSSSSSSLPPRPPPPPLLPTPASTPSDSYKEKGNDCFSRGDYDNAMLHYTSAIGASSNSNADALSTSKLFTNRALCALRQAYSGSSPPTTFSIRDLAIAAASNHQPSVSERRRLLQQCVADCSKAQQFLQPTSSTSSPSALQLSKALLRKSQAQALLGEIEASAESAKAVTRLLDQQLSSNSATSSEFTSHRTSAATWYDSLKQLEKDKAAVISSLSAADHVLSRDRSCPLDRVVLTAASACGSASGSLPAIAGVAATVAHNILVSSLAHHSSDDGASIRGFLASVTEAVAKAVHCHGGAPNFAALAVFDVLQNLPLLPNLLQPRSDASLSAALASVAYQGAGIAAATTAGLIGMALPAMGDAARDAVLLCGGNASAAARVAKSISGKGGDDGGDGGDDDDDVDAADGASEESAPPPPPIQHPDASFIPSSAYTGSKENHVFRLGSKGLGYYEDLGYLGPDTAPATKKKTKKEKKRLLDPDHPAFAGMAPSQIEWLESMLKLSDKEIEELPPDQRDIVTQFRNIWKESPEAFRKRPPVHEPNVDDANKSEYEKQKEKEKKELNDPLKWLKAHSESLDWFQRTHGAFDKEAFLTAEKENARKQKEEVDKLELDRQARIKQQADDLMSDLCSAQKKPSKPDSTGEKKVATKASKSTASGEKADDDKKKKKKAAADDKADKKKDLQDLLKWSSGGA